MKRSYDILIIGGGPAGCTAAHRLAAAGFDVAVAEEHAVIGEPVDCTGVIGSEVFERFDLPRHLVLGSIDGITIHSPAGITITHRNGGPLAYVVDRAELDRGLARRAEQAGATFHLNTRAIEVTPHTAGVGVTCRIGDAEVKEFDAKVLILAGGPRFAFQERLGLGACPVLWRSAHSELAGNGLPNAQVYLGRDVAPGAFAWAVPVRRAGQPFVRVGVNSHADASGYLRRLCEEKFPHLIPNDRPLTARSWVVPIVPLARTYAERVLAVGDAAGQVKPTSGGGIYFGMLSAELAADTAAEACRQGKFGRDVMGGYEKRWRSSLGLDLKIGTLFRRLFSRMADHDVDHLFRTLRQEGLLQHIAGKVSFDWHRELIVFLLRHPSLARLFLRRCWDRSAEPPFSDVPAIGD